jgi:hypothetical protein
MRENRRNVATKKRQLIYSIHIPKEDPSSTLNPVFAVAFRPDDAEMYLRLKGLGADRVRELLRSKRGWEWAEEVSDGITEEKAAAKERGERVNPLRDALIEGLESLKKGAAPRPSVSEVEDALQSVESSNPLGAWYGEVETDPEVIRMALDFAEKSRHRRTSEVPLRILDPFAGTGNVLVEASLRGWDAFWCELNPLYRYMAEVKFETLALTDEALEATTREMRRLAVRLRTVLMTEPVDRMFLADLKKVSGAGVNALGDLESRETLAKLRHLIDSIRSYPKLESHLSQYGPGLDEILNDGGGNSTSPESETEFGAGALVSSSVLASLLELAVVSMFRKVARRPSDGPPVDLVGEVKARTAALTLWFEQLRREHSDSQSSFKLPEMVSGDAEDLHRRRPLEVDLLFLDPPSLISLDAPPLIEVGGGKVEPELWFLRRGSEREIFLKRTEGLYPSRPSSNVRKDPTRAEQRARIRKLVNSPHFEKIAKYGAPMAGKLASTLEEVLNAIVTDGAPWHTVRQVDRYYRRMFVLLTIFLPHLRRGGVVAVFSSETEVGGYLIRQPELVRGAMELLEYKLEQRKVIRKDDRREGRARKADEGKKKKELLLFKKV